MKKITAAVLILIGSVLLLSAPTQTQASSIWMAPIYNVNVSRGPSASDDYPQLALIAYSAETYREEKSTYPENLGELLNFSQLAREQFSQLEGQINLEATQDELKMNYTDQLNGFNSTTFIEPGQRPVLKEYSTESQSSVYLDNYLPKTDTTSSTNTDWTQLYVIFGLIVFVAIIYLIAYSVSRRRLKFQRKRKPTDPDPGLEKTWREMKAEQRKETS